MINFDNEDEMIVWLNNHAAETEETRTIAWSIIRNIATKPRDIADVFTFLQMKRKKEFSATIAR
jgi:hypothetical protein